MSDQSNIIPINIAPLDKEIAEAEEAVKLARERLSQLEAVLTQKQLIKKYILSLGQNNKNGADHYTPTSGTAYYGHLKTDIAESNLGISDFIIKELNGRSKTTKELADEFAKYKGWEFEIARNNISNALARLRDIGKIDRRFRSGERGADWFLIQ